MVRLGFTEDLVDEDMMALLKYVPGFIPESGLTIGRKVHRLANADTEFDFHDSFWRYEVALQRHRGQDHLPVSPNDLLLEVQSDVTPTNLGNESQQHHPITSPLSRLQSMFGPASDTFQSDPPAIPRDQGSTPGEVDWQAAFSLPSIDLQTLMGVSSAGEGPAMPFAWSYNGLNI